MQSILLSFITAIISMIREFPEKCLRIRMVYPRCVWLMIAWFFAALPAFAQNIIPPQFTDVTQASGLKFKHNFGAEKVKNLLMTTGGGCALFDYDNDGWLDAFLVNSTNLDRRGRPLTDGATYHALFHNQGDGTFKNVTKAAGITKATYGQGCAVADYDGDGFIDIYITNYGSNQLYRNLGDGTFEDVTASSGTSASRWSTGAVFFDYDGDDDLDLYVSHYVVFKYKKIKRWTNMIRGEKRILGPSFYRAEDDILYRNNGNGTFTDVSKEAGLVSGGNGFTALAADFDGDGDQDIFVANDKTANFLYENNGGKFTEIALEAGVAFDPNGKETAAMGGDIIDVDGDGKEDIHITNIHFEFNNLYRNQGDMMFSDETKTMRLDEDNWFITGWATRFVDFNNDGYLDCFVANGAVQPPPKSVAHNITYQQMNMLFIGNREGRFKNMAGECGNGFQKKQVSRGAAFGDYDNDGDIDILVSNNGGWAKLLRNDLPANDRWMKICLKGQSPNTNAIGAKVVTRLENRTISSEVRFASAYVGGSDPTIHIGLRPGETEGSIEVTWPSGKKSTRKIQAGTMTIIEEPTRSR